jgi:hypothetical protein
MCAENIKKKNRKLAFIAMPAILLAASVAISFVITEDAYAKNGRYTGDTSQAAAVSNECLNPIFGSNEDIDNAVGIGNCGSTVSQQDESGSASAPITSQTANPDIELQRATTTSAQPPLTGESCEDCFDSLTAAQVSEFETRLPENFGSSVTTIEELCDFLAAQSGESLPALIDSVGDTLEGLPQTIPPPSLQAIIAIENCLGEIFG